MPPASPYLPGLAKARASIWRRIGSLFAGRAALAPADLGGLEEALLMADLGAAWTARFLEDAARMGRAWGEEELGDLLRRRVASSFPTPPPEPAVPPPRVTFLVGVNGTGKTTTAGKLAAFARRGSRSVLLVAGDTFRAAAVEQLEAWARRSGALFFRGPEGADPASVVHDALQQARAKQVDEVLVDTAGRMHTKTSLMGELSKMARVAGKVVPGAPHRVMLVLDAAVGQNALSQARTFTGAIGVTGLVMTRMDGTARGGILIPIAAELGIPVLFVGLGEGVGDLAPFDPGEYARGLLG
jgi:fused signal recognition particle receptor